MAGGHGWGGASARVPTTSRGLPLREGFSSLHPSLWKEGSVCWSLCRRVCLRYYLCLQLLPAGDRR